MAEQTVSVQRVCVRCGRWGVQQYISARPDGIPAVTGEAWVCANEPACRRRAAGRTSPVRSDTTPAIQRLAEVQFRAYDSEYGTDRMTVADFYPTARADLTAALDVEEMARAADPKAFEDHPIERRSRAAAVQWAARRKIATDHAQAIRAALLGEA